MKYYTPTEVSQHNCLEDCWVTIHSRVLDLTDLLNENRGSLIDPILKVAGKIEKKMRD